MAFRSQLLVDFEGLCGHQVECLVCVSVPPLTMLLTNRCLEPSDNEWALDYRNSGENRSMAAFLEDVFRVGSQYR